MISTLMKGVIRNGRVETDPPIDLADGTELLISVLNGKTRDDDEGWDVSAKGIAEWLKWCDSLQPLKIAAEEEADADQWLKQINDRDSPMSIENEKQMENAQAKLRLLQKACDKLKEQPGPNPYVDELSVRALHSQIKQLKEEMAPYQNPVNGVRARAMTSLELAIA